jgi:hypothetical protein
MGGDTIVQAVNYFALHGVLVYDITRFSVSDWAVRYVLISVKGLSYPHFTNQSETVRQLKFCKLAVHSSDAAKSNNWYNNVIASCLENLLLSLLV